MNDQNNTSSPNQENLAQINNLDQQNEQPNKNFAAHNSGFLKEVQKEIQKESIRLNLMAIFSAIILLGIAIFWVFFLLLLDYEIGQMVLLIMATVISGWIFLFSLMNWYQFNQEKKVHFSDIFKIDGERIPIFAISAYKRNFFWKTFFNWLACVIYFCLGLLILFLFYLNSLVGVGKFTFLTFEISVQRDWKENQIIALQVVSICIFVGVSILHALIYVQTTKRQARLNALFDLENKMKNESWRKYKRNVRILFAFIFLFPLAIVLLILLFRKKSKRN